MPRKVTAAELKEWVRVEVHKEVHEMSKVEVRNELKHHLGRVIDVEQEYAQAAVAAAAETSFLKVQEDCSQWQERAEERVYERLCTLIFEKGLTDRLTAIEKRLAAIETSEVTADRLTAIEKRLAASEVSLSNTKRTIDTNAGTTWMSMSQLCAGLNELSRDIRGMQESIDHALDIENINPN